VLHRASCEQPSPRSVGAPEFELPEEESVFDVLTYKTMPCMEQRARNRNLRQLGSRGMLAASSAVCLHACSRLGGTNDCLQGRVVLQVARLQ
jgi:hypothetical protein